MLKITAATQTADGAVTLTVWDDEWPEVDPESGEPTQPEVVEYGAPPAEVEDLDDYARQCIAETRRLIAPPAVVAEEPEPPRDLSALLLEESGE